MSLTEYLYVDERRLNSYFEQISSPVTYDKVPVWKASLSLTGPNAEGQQARFARSFTQHEKMMKVSEFIKNEGTHETFFTVSCEMTRVLVPPKTLNSDFKGLVLWIAEPTRNERMIDTLCLLEDNRRDDDDERAFWGTAFSALTVFLKDMSDQVNESILESNLPRVGIGSPADKEFHKNPLAFLRTLGAQAYPKRSIHSMYRKRITSGKMESPFPEENERKSETEPDYTVTIGYPIWIADGPSR